MLKSDDEITVLLENVGYDRVRLEGNTVQLDSRNAVHKRMKWGRTGQIAALGAVGYYGFTTIGDVNIKSVENDIFLENGIKTDRDND